MNQTDDTPDVVLHAREVLWMWGEINRLRDVEDDRNYWRTLAQRQLDERLEHNKSVCAQLLTAALNGKFK